MASSDLRDVLSLPDGHAAGGARPSKKQKLSAPRPNLKGLAREVHNLGGDNPIAIVPEVTQFKKRRLASRKPTARWEMRAFRNSGREDQSLILRHWRRKEPKEPKEGDEGEQATVKGEEAAEEEIEDSAFAKYHVQVSVPQYSDDQYQQSLQNSDWSKEETDYLMGLARDFDLRWPLIWDRYEWTPPTTNREADENADESMAVVAAPRSRSLEALKARYYEVASKMMAAQKPVQYMTQPEFALHELMAHYNPQQEKMRKDFAINSLARSREEAREEESLLLEIKRILARSERFNEERRELYNRLDYPHAETDINTFKSSTGLQTLLQNLMSADKTKKRKSIMGTDGVSPSGPAAPQAAASEAGKRDSTAAPAPHRDSIGGGGAAATPTGGNKKAQQQQQPERRKLNAQEEAIYGVAHFDRLGSGPTFRTEKINKLFSHKSNQQQVRINNTLNELDVPSKLAMPTAATTHQFEQLLGAVNSLLEARKVSDKVEAEIKLELAKKMEREKTLATPEIEQEQTKNANEEDAAPAPVAEKPAEADEEDSKPAQLDEEDNTAKQGNGEKEGEQEKEDGGEQQGNKEDDVEASVEQADEIPEREKSLRPGSSGVTRKRSASVLSNVSAKRQKK